MAYTAAGLSYLIQGSPKPIVLTGAQKPIGFDSTDSKVNLTDALRCAAEDLPGVAIVFDGKVIPGTRAKKTRSKSFQAFSSINFPYLGSCGTGCCCGTSALSAESGRYSATGWTPPWPF